MECIIDVLQLLEGAVDLLVFVVVSEPRLAIAVALCGQLGGAMAVLFSVVSGPGHGKPTSKFSEVPQLLPTLPTLAEKTSGLELKAVLSVPEPTPIVTLAQFMYISRLPILLNHVQAKRAGPVGVSLGTLKG